MLSFFKQISTSGREDQVLEENFTTLSTRISLTDNESRMNVAGDSAETGLGKFRCDPYDIPQNCMTTIPQNRRMTMIPQSRKTIIPQNFI